MNEDQLYTFTGLVIMRIDAITRAALDQSIKALVVSTAGNPTIPQVLKVFRDTISNELFDEMSTIALMIEYS
jgi:hypothetical protein